MLRYKMILRGLLLIGFTCCVCGTFEVNVTQSFFQAKENDDITLEWRFTNKADTSHDFITISAEMSTDQWAKPMFDLHRGEEVPQSQDIQFSDRVPCEKDVSSEISTDQRAKVLFHLHESEEVPQSQVEQFAGRVQCDKDVLREGRFRLHLSRLRIEDSGLYMFEVMTSSGVREVRFHLSVTAARDQLEPEKPNTMKNQPEPERPNTARDQSEPERPNTARNQPEPERTNTMKDQPEPERPNTASQGRIALYWSPGVTAALLLVCGLLIFHLLSKKKKGPSKSNGESEKRHHTKLTAAAEPRSANTSSALKTSGRTGKIYQVMVNGIRGEKVLIDLGNTEEQMKSMTVLQLKEKIAQKLPDTAGLDNMRLIFTDKALEKDTDLLSEYGIQHKSVIHIVLKVNGGLTA